jgi:polyisoprenoid-binding protein YceI
VTKETIMHTLSEQITASALMALLKDGALAGEWVLDPHSSSIRLTSRVMGGLIRVNGVFREVSGDCTVSPDGAVTGSLTVAAASIDTKNARRDTHLRSADFLDSDNYPDITFTAGTVRLSGHGVTMAGALTVCGRTQPLSFDATASVRGNGDIWIDAEVIIDRADFGLTWNPMGMASTINALTVHATLARR